MADLRAAPPNVLLVVADDLGYGDLGCYGATDIRTPNLDRLAREGVRFTRFYANGPECTPTRAALLTGQYPQRPGGLECAIGIGGVGRYDDAIRLAAAHELGLPASETTLARRLARVGYRTAIVGKWHLGYEEKFSPMAHGFDFALYAIGGGMDYFHHVEDPPTYLPALRLQGQLIRRTGQYATDLFADEAIRWLRAWNQSSPREPFFLYLPFTAPHSPYQTPEEYSPEPLPEGSPRWKQHQAPPQVYAAMIERLDHRMGDLLNTLEELQCATSTVVIFVSDNGGTPSARPCGLRGYKGMTFEGGIRVPCLVRWPGVLPAGRTETRPFATFDLTVSITRAAGLPPPIEDPYDGVDVLAIVAGHIAFSNRPLFWRGRREQRTWKAVLDEPLKLIVLEEPGRRQEWLFDLSHDPREQNDLLAARPEDARRLRELLARWERDVRPRR